MWALGINDAVEYAATLPFVDKSRIGVSGHSNGALSANLAVVHDNQRPQPLISSVVLVANDAFYTDDAGAWTNIYGHRDVAIIADRYDEFFFNGGNLEGKPATQPARDFLSSPEARRFLSFGLEPPAGFVATSGVVSSQALDGTTAHRVISMIDGEHALATINPAAISALIDFFGDSLHPPRNLPGSDQIWGAKLAFNALGLVALGVLITLLAGTLMRCNAPAPQVAPLTRLTGRRRVLWWVFQVVGVAFSAFSYLWIAGNTTVMGLALQLGPSGVAIGPVFVIGLWAAANGIFLLVVNAWGWLHPAPGSTRAPQGGRSAARSLVRAVLVALATAAVAYLIVATAQYFFTSDVRFWVVAFKATTPEKFGYLFAYLPLYLVYFVPLAVVTNTANRVHLAGGEATNTAVTMAIAVAGPVILVAYQYITMAVTGYPAPGFMGLFSIWLFPLIVIIPTAVLVSRRLYLRTGSTYLGGLVMAVIATLISVSNSLMVIG